MSRKVYEIAFAIAGKMNGNFNGTFSAASSKMAQLKIDISKLNAQYKKGEISAEQFGTAHQHLNSQLSQTRQALNKAKQAQNQYNQSILKQHEISKMGSAVGGSVRNALSVGVGGGALALGAGGFVLGASLKKAIDYEAQLSSIQALTGINNDELKKMDELALKMGADTKYSALQAAQGIEELLKAGMSPAVVQAGGLEAALNLATAGGLDLTEAAETMSDALNGFKKDGMTAADAANILAGAANASSTDVHKLRESLQAVGPVGDLLGANFKSINGTLAAFSNNSLKGSDAGTSLKTMLMNLQPQTKEARGLFAKFGLTAADGKNQFFQANGQMKDMADVAGLLQDKFKKLNDQQRADAFYNLFGSDAVRAASILYKEGAEGIQKMYKEMADVTALQVAKKKMDNAAGSIEQLKGAIETLQIRALRPTLPFIKKLADEAGNFVEEFTPAITKGVQDGVDSAKRYFKTHFVDNPDFKNLDRQAKFEFIMTDLKKTFDAWYAGGGNKQISDATSGLIGFVSDALHGSSEQLTKVGIDLGMSVGGGMLTGLKQFASQNPELAALLAFVATPGPPAVKAAAALAVGTSGTFNNATDKVYENRAVTQKQSLENINKIQNSNAEHPFLSNTTLSGGQDRSFIKNLWDDARVFAINKGWMETPKGDKDPVWKSAPDKIAANTGNVTINAPFAPVINGNPTPEFITTLQGQQKAFTDNLQDEFRRQKRLSYDD